MKTGMIVGGIVLLLAPKLYPRAFLSSVPQEARETYLGVITADGRCLEGVRKEYSTLEDHYATVRAAHITSVGDIPLIVLSRGQTQSWPGLSEEANRKYEQTLQQMQIELAQQSLRGKRIVAAKSGHLIQIDEPEVVVEAIREVVEAARTR